MDRNAILAAVLSLAVLLAWQYLVIGPEQQAEQTRQQKAKQAEQNKQAELPETSKPLAAPPPAVPAKTEPAKQAPVAVAPSGTSAGAAVEGNEARLVRVNTGVAVFELTSQGAGITAVRLKNYHNDEGAPIDLARHQRPQMRPLYFWGGEAAARLNHARYRVEGGNLNLTSGKAEGTVRFVYAGAGGLRAEKVFTFFRGSYHFALRVRVENPKATPIGLAWGPGVGGSEGQTYGGVVEGPMTLVGKKIVYDHPKAGKPVTHGADAHWTSLQSKYFITAIIPRSGAAGAELRYLREVKDAADEFAAIVPLSDPKNANARFDIYAGPKEVSRMARLGVGLQDSLDYGIFGFISRPLMAVLRFLHTFVGNWGVAIILLTVLVKLLFYPLTFMSMRNMKEMQRLQPRMNQIREIYKNDKAKMNEQVMALYREHKVNPMMGCLPMIIQIPVFFGLYEALLVSIELRNAPFFWWITDLSKPDPYQIYTILMGISMFVQQKMTPTAADPTQAKMMYLMPVVFTAMFIFYPVPVGLVIYWLVNNLLSIAQQYFVNRSVKPPKLAESS